jgi:hypothetical protein
VGCSIGSGQGGIVGLVFDRKILSTVDLQNGSTRGVNRVQNRFN